MIAWKKKQAIQTLNCSSSNKLSKETLTHINCSVSPLCVNNVTLTKQNATHSQTQCGLVHHDGSDTTIAYE